MRKRTEICVSLRIKMTFLTIISLTVVFCISGFISAANQNVNDYQLLWLEKPTQNSYFIRDIAWSPNSTQVSIIYSSGEGGCISVINTQSGNRTDLKHNLSGGYSTSFTASDWSPNGDTIAVSNWNGDVIIYNLTTMQKKYVHRSLFYQVDDLAFSPGGEKLAFTTNLVENCTEYSQIEYFGKGIFHGPIEIVDTKTLVPLALINFYHGNNYSTDYHANKLFWSPDAMYIATVTYGNIILISDTSNLVDNVTEKYSLHSITELNSDTPLKEMCWSPDSSEIATIECGESWPLNYSSIKIWNKTSGEIIRQTNVSGYNWISSIEWVNDQLIIAGEFRGMEYMSGKLAILNSTDFSYIYQYENTNLISYPISTTQGDLKVSPDNQMICVSFGNKVAMFCQSTPQISNTLVYSSIIGIPMCLNCPIIYKWLKRKKL